MVEPTLSTIGSEMYHLKFFTVKTVITSGHRVMMYGQDTACAGQGGLPTLCTF